MSLVSVVIPCYRAENYLAGAIESCLRQTLTDFEVIVVDDGSPDDTRRIAREYAARDPRVRVVWHERNRGISEAFNTGFAAAAGEYFTRLAHDDLFRADALERMVARLRADPDCGLVYCDMLLIDAAGNPIHPLPSEEPERALLPADRVGVCVMWPRRVWEAVGPFDPRFDTAEDYEFFLRVSRRFRLAKCPGEPPFFFRYHPGQVNRTQSKRLDYAYARAQLAHVQALAAADPFRPRYWAKLATGSLRVLRRGLAYRAARARPQV